MPCYDSCPYFVVRDLASKSPTALLNYAYWLIMQNYVNKTIDEPLFPPRHFTICDEGHKILDIIQNHYSPRFDPKTTEKLEKLTEFFAVFKVKDHYIDYRNIQRCIEKLFETENQDKLHEILLEIEESFEEYLPSIETLKTKVNDDYPDTDPPKEWRDPLS